MLGNRTLYVHPGDDLVARFPGAVLLIAARQGDADLVSRMLDLARQAQPGDGRRLVRRMVALVADADPDAVPAFAVLGQMDSGVAVLASGNVDLVQPDGDRASAAQLVSWLERVVAEPVEGVAVVAAGAEVPRSDAPVDLREGVVWGGGFTIGAEGAPSASAAAVAADVAPTPAPAEVPTGAPAEAPPHAAQATPVAQEPVHEPIPQPAPVGAPPEGVRVRGRYCEHGHFNSPMVGVCVTCGAPLPPSPDSVVEGVRPPLGRVVVDDGASFVLDADYEIGTAPDDHPDVQAGRARALPLPDVDGSVARVHARIALDGWDAHFADEGSPNGTYFSYPGDTEWTRVIPGQPAPLHAGVRMLVGRRMLTFEPPPR